MEWHVGTSGFAYKEWRGTFYPEGLSETQMLSFYARQLNSVEIDSTFYRFPTPGLLSDWRGQVTEGFTFCLKVPQRITHIKRLQGITEELLYLLETVQSLGAHLGPLLFQFPPNMPRNLQRLEALLRDWPTTLPAAFEFRNESWHERGVLALLEANNLALCITDLRRPDPELVATADWGYLRLRRPSYSEAELNRWASNVAARPWHKAYLFIKHTQLGNEPLTALRLHQSAHAAASL